MELEKKEIKNDEIISSLLLNGDMSKLNPIQKVEYYNKLCESLGLNPLTKPFDIIKLQGKETLYAKKDCAEQLRKINGISVIDQQDNVINDIFIVNVKVQDKTGRLDTGKGCVNIKGMSGDNLANAMMKAETKAKRRATLSISGLGILDETELETIPELKEIKPDLKSFKKETANNANEQAKNETYVNKEILKQMLGDITPDKLSKEDAVYIKSILKSPVLLNDDFEKAKIEVQAIIDKYKIKPELNYINENDKEPEFLTMSDIMDGKDDELPKGVL